MELGILFHNIAPAYWNDFFPELVWIYSFTEFTYYRRELYNLQVETQIEP